MYHNLKSTLPAIANFLAYNDIFIDRSGTIIFSSCAVFCANYDALYNFNLSESYRIINNEFKLWRLYREIKQNKTILWRNNLFVELNWLTDFGRRVIDTKLYLFHFNSNCKYIADYVIASDISWTILLDGKESQPIKKFKMHIARSVSE